MYNSKINNFLKSLAEFGSIDSIPKALSTLDKLDEELPETKLVNLKYFNHAYLIITKNMSKQIQCGNFKYEEQVRKLIINFISLYFQAIENYHNKHSVPKAWEITFRFCEKRQSNSLIYLALGANAHINNDLPFALKNTIKNASFYSDYQKIGQVIEFSLHEAVVSISQPSPRLNFIDRQLIWLDKFIIKFLLNQWRKAAWSNYLKLIKENIVENQIKLTAGRKANQILIISAIKFPTFGR